MASPSFNLDVQTEIPLRDFATAFWELSYSEQIEVLRTLIEEARFDLDELVEEIRG